MNSPASVPELQGLNNGITARPANAWKGSGSRMEPAYWIPPDATSLLDVGCNAGALLRDLHRRYPKMELTGIDINQTAVQIAKATLPDVEIHQGFGYELPFETGRFQYATCIEVIEHVPEAHRARTISEIQRVLAPGGLLLLRCPHAGAFDWLDAQNFRFRFPGLYKTLVGRGNRDQHYDDAGEELIWHHHFTREELLGVAGGGWKEEACLYGGLALFPISDIIRWPFYRMKKNDNWFVRILEKISAAELAIDFGKRSYDILLILRKV
jgi:SAM-dependent methyltransferase